MPSIGPTLACKLENMDGNNDELKLFGVKKLIPFRIPTQFRVCLIWTLTYLALGRALPERVRL